jgi:hypothetical protein
MTNFEKLVRWDAEKIFSLDFSDNHYRLTQQHIEALKAMYPAIEWDTRWTNTELYTSDERQAFASELMYRLMNPVDCAEQEIDNCLEYANNVTFLSYSPQNPHTEPDVIPAGYPNSPFFKFGSIIPDSLPDWLEDFVEDWATEMTGYEPDDVLTVINSFPLFASWEDILTSGLPRITLEFSGVGIVQIRLLLVPFGSRAIITVDVEPNIADIISNIFEGNVRSIELERDFSSIPLETDIDHIEEIVLTEDIEHTIYITFLPVVDITLLPLKYGGGIRSVTFCGEFAFAEAPIADIPTIIADDTYFETEYVPVVFGEFYSATVAQAAAQAAIYDDTPQSVAPDVPVAAPNAVEKNALCYAVNRFVELYSSQKLCLIQSQNFLETFFHELAGAANNFYNTLSNLMLPFYSANIFSCFVDDTAAMAALVDAAAIEELACFIYEELKTVAMSQANFDAAILDAATTLTGNAQDIACLMQNDSSEDIFIAFLLGYNIAIERQNDGDDLECPCETDTYWMKVYDFALGAHGWTGVVSGTTLTSAHVGDRFSGVGTQSGCLVRLNSFGDDYIIRACGVAIEALGFTGVGSDSIRTAGWSTENVSGTERLTGSVSALTQATVDAQGGIFEHRDIAEGLSSESYQVAAQNSGTKSGSNYTDILKIVLYGLPNAGQKPPGSVWVSGVPASPLPLFPS